MIVWLWRAGPWQGVTDDLGTARARVEGCITRGAAAGLVQAAVVRFDQVEMQRGYMPTGRVMVARKAGAEIEWTPLFWLHENRAMVPA